MKTLVKLASFCALLYGSQALAQYPSVKVHGHKLSCKAHSGQTVLFYDHWHAARAAARLGGARADYHPQYGYRIALSPKFMNSLPRLGAIFTIYHECAHTALPIGIGLASAHMERNADCHAIKSMRRHGLIQTWPEFDEAVSAVIQSGGGHYVDSQRLNAMAKCMTP